MKRVLAVGFISDRYGEPEGFFSVEHAGKEIWCYSMGSDRKAVRQTILQQAFESVADRIAE